MTYRLTRKERRRIKSSTMQREIEKRRRIAEAALKSINNLSFRERLSFCWAVLRRKV